jgi:hypothetical protein
MAIQVRVQAASFIASIGLFGSAQAALHLAREEMTRLYRQIACLANCYLTNFLDHACATWPRQRL